MPLIKNRRNVVLVVFMKKSIFTISVILFVFIICYAFLSACANKRFGLTDTKFSVNHHLTQEREPTKAEKLDGVRALKKWKSSESERSHLADDLILGKTLIDMKAEEVLELFGPPDACYANDEYIPGQTREFGYQLPLEGYSVNELIVDLDKDGKIEKAYIDINY